MADPIDFQSYLAGDLTYQDAINAINQARAADQAALDASRYQSLINYGELPDTSAAPQSVQDFLAAIPQSIKDAVALATNAGWSQVAQRQRTYNLAQSLMRGNLGERGIIRSSDYGYLTNKNLRDQQIGQAGDLQTMLSNWLTAQQNYLSQLDSLRGQQTDAANAAWQRMIAAINAQATTPTAPTPAPANPDANPNNPDLVPNRFVPTPTTTPGLNIPAVDDQGYAIPDPNGYPYVYPGSPTTPFVPDFSGPYDPSGALSLEPKTNIDTPAYGNQGVAAPYNTPTSPAVPDFYTPTVTDVPGGQSYDFTPAQDQQISQDPNALQYVPSDAASSYEPPSAPPPGYGTTLPGSSRPSTYYQIQRNMRD